jgi:DNA-binding protein WhiA
VLSAMSFSGKVKNELGRVMGEQGCCQRAELSSLLTLDALRESGSDGSQAVIIKTENASVARKLFTLLKRFSSLSIELFIHKQTRLRKNNIYKIKIPPQRELVAFLQELELLDAHSRGNIGRLVTEKRCCRRAYLRGAFLAAGSTINPERGYHLELVPPTSEIAAELVKLMQTFELDPRIVMRKARPVVYLKEAEQISRFFSVIGAHGALLEFENVRVYKDVRNKINRLVNCETANLGKTVAAALRQREKIEYLRQSIGFNRIPPGLREIARLRLEHPEMSLKELGQNLTPKLGKSGVNHRLRRLEALADGLLKPKDREI